MSARHRRRLAKPATIALGAALAFSLSYAPSQASAAAAAPAHPITLDGVALQVSTPDYPSGSLYTTPAGGLVQVASLSDNAPFRYLSITAAPYGETLPESKFPVSKKGNAAAWRAAQNGVQNGPTAELFGQKVVGQILHTRIPGTNGSPDTAVETISWIVEASDRTWVVNLQHDESSLPTAFGSGLTVTSGAGAKTTVDLTAPTSGTAHHDTTTATASTATRGAMAMTTAAASATVPLGGTLGRPSWWSSDCDGYTNNGTHLLNSKFMGLQVCGYPSTDKLEGNIPYGSVGQYEFECAELPQRYLVQRYGEYGPGGNGNTEVDNWYNQYPSQFQRYANGAHTPPVPGDVVSFSVGGTSFGHTGVVIASNVDSNGNGTISMVHQNWNENTSTPGEWDGIPVSNWNVEEVTGQGGTVEWLHNPADSAAPPSVSAPGGIAANGNYSGTVTVTGTASPAATAFYVHLQQGGVDKKVYPVGAGGSSFSYGVDTTQVPNGTYQVEIGAAINGANYFTPSANDVTITVTNIPSAPTVQVPAGRVENQVTFTASAPGASSVTYYVDGVNIGSSSASGFALSWDSAGTFSADGPHQVTATASNGSGRSSASAPVTLDVENRVHASSLVESNGTLDVFTRDATDGNLVQTYLPNGGSWTKYDLTVNAGAAHAAGSPFSWVRPDGTVDVYYRGVDGHLYELYLKPGGSWTQWDVSAAGFAPATISGDPSVVNNNGVINMFTRDAFNGNLVQTYWSSTANNWAKWDVTASGYAPTIG